MPHISRRKIDPEIKDQILNSLTYLIKDLNNAYDADIFLSSVLSDTERLMISKRVATAFLLQHNVESLKIQDTLKLTPATVFRLKLWIQTHQVGFDCLFNKLEKQRRSESVRMILYELLDYAIVAGSGRIPNPLNKKFQKGTLL